MSNFKKKYCLVSVSYTHLMVEHLLLEWMREQLMEQPEQVRSLEH